MSDVSLAVGVGLLCALLSALGTNLAFLLKYKGAVAAPDVDMRHPLRSAADLFGSKWWSIGWGVAAVAFTLHVAALSLAPISIGQAVLAGGLVFLAVLAERFFGFELGRRQWIGIGLVAVSLSLLTVTGGGGRGGAHSGYSLSGMIIFEAIAICVGVLLVVSHLTERIPEQRGVLLGIAAGLGFGISDVAIKALSGDLDSGPVGLLSPWSAIIVTAAVFSFYASARSLQIGDGVVVIAVTSVAANLSTILAGLAVFGDRLGESALAVGVRIAAFALILVGAALIPAPVRAGEMLDESEAAPDGPTDDAPATLQSRLEGSDPGGQEGAVPAYATADPTISDPVALLRHLDVSGRFHRDSRVGRVYHRGMVSLRENVASDSLHIVVDDNRVVAHVDGISPLAARSQSPSRYSVSRVAAHNLAGVAQDLLSLLRGRQGDHGCELNCEWASSEGPSTLEEPRPLDLKTSARGVQLEARVAASLDEARLRSALAVALGHHVSARRPLEVVECHDDDALVAARARLQGTAVSLTDGPPLHVYLVRHPAGDVLMLNLNHAAADGPGALRVLDAIARAYADDADSGDPLDFLATRDLPVRPASASVSGLARSWKRAVELLRNMLARPARLARDQPREQPGYGFHLVGLSVEETRRVVSAKRPHTSTDILVAALHQTIGDWNLQHGTPGRRVGVLVPANLRSAQWRQDWVGNFSVTTRVTTNRRDRTDPGAALKAVTDQSARNKRARTGVALIAGLHRAGMLTLWAKQSTVVLQPLTNNRLVDIAMVCNLGWLNEAPSFGPDVGEIQELWFSTPARSPLSVCLGAVTVRGRLHLTFRYPQRLFSPGAARRFAECYLDHVLAVSDSRS
ncbi:MAG: hypothetical protein QOG15_2480 [Solirubrobacteraceae bacterium]|nr:hypothetical protein [Solirubrobacteraceae bacterium]